MKYIAILVFLSSIPCVTGSLPATFGVRQPPLFGIRAGASNDSAPKNDYERAETAIFHGMEEVEARLQKAVEEEVHSIFDADDGHPRKAEVADHAKVAVTKGASKIKESAREYYKAQQGPLWPKQDEKNVQNNDHRLLHAIESAEKAVLHAVQEEVDSLFHETHDAHHPLKDEPKSAKKANQGVKKGVQKAKKHVEDSHKVRKGWMANQDGAEIEDYMKSITSVYGMGF